MSKIVEGKSLQGNGFKFIIFEDEQLGSGAYSKCYLGFEPASAKLVIVKKLKCKDLQKSEEFKASYRKELKNLFAASQRYKKEYHSNIVNVEKFAIVCERPSSLVAFIVMEYCKQGTLGQLLDIHRVSYKFFSFGEVCSIFRDLINGYGQLFAEGILHQDLKPENILISDGHFKIGDFGLSYKLSDAHITVGGTPSYNAPEKYTSKLVPDSSQDIYSLGIIFHFLIFGCHPYFQSEEFQIHFKEEKKKYLRSKQKTQNCGMMINNRGMGPKVIVRDFGNDRQKLIFTSSIFHKFLLGKHIFTQRVPHIKTSGETENKHLRNLIELVYRMISFNIEQRPSYHEIVQSMEKNCIKFQPVSIPVTKSLPQRYRFIIQNQSPIEPEPLPYEPLEDESIRMNTAVFGIRRKAERVNAVGNLLMDISTILENEIKAHQIYNKCIREMVEALKVFGYCMTYQEYMEMLDEIRSLGKEDLCTFYRTRQDYLVHNTKTNKEYFEEELDNCWELRTCTPTLTFTIMEDFIQQVLRQGHSDQDVLVDHSNMNCFMIMTVVFDLLRIDNRDSYTIEQVLHIRRKYSQIYASFNTFNTVQVNLQLSKYNICPILVQISSDDD